MRGDTPWLRWQGLLDAPGVIRPCLPPAPRPPLGARPRQLSVTQVETWMRDPYAIFARHILKLKPLDPIDADPGAAEHGSFVHQALDAFIRAHPKHLPGDALERLIECGRQAFGDALARPAVWSFWWPRFCRIAAWFVDHQRKTSHLSLPIATEVKGKLDLVTAAGAFTLTAKADRIDRLASGDLAIIDYKTGMPPSAKQVKAGFAPQLPLEAYMATQGAFEGIDAGAVGALVYWRLRGRDPVAEIKPIKGDSDELALSARDGLIALVETFADPSTPYLSRPRPAHAGYGDYDHLARVKEWSASSGGGE